MPSDEPAGRPQSKAAFPESPPSPLPRRARVPASGPPGGLAPGADSEGKVLTIPRSISYSGRIGRLRKCLCPQPHDGSPAHRRVLQKHRVGTTAARRQRQEPARQADHRGDPRLRRRTRLRRAQAPEQAGRRQHHERHPRQHRPSPPENHPCQPERHAAQRQIHPPFGPRRQRIAHGGREHQHRGRKPRKRDRPRSEPSRQSPPSSVPLRQRRDTGERELRGRS